MRIAKIKDIRQRRLLKGIMGVDGNKTVMPTGKFHKDHNGDIDFEFVYIDAPKIMIGKKRNSLLFNFFVVE